MKKIIFSLAIVLAVSVSFLFAGQPNMSAGKWEITSQIDMPNMPFKMPATKTVQCISKKDLEDKNKTTPGANKDKCEITDYKVKGNTVTWKTKCKDGTEGSGEVTYNGASYSGKMIMDIVDKKGTKSKMNYKFTGKRVGDC